MRAVRNTCSEYDDLAHRAGNILDLTGGRFFQPTIYWNTPQNYRADIALLKAVANADVSPSNSTKASFHQLDL